VLNLKVPHHLQYLNRFGLPENLVAAELVAKRLAALILLKWDLVSGAVVVSVVVFAVNVVVEFVVPVHF
jgi:putative flippase GtrA